MAGLPVLVIGSDRSWRLRLQRILAGRADLQWLGAFAPAEARLQLPQGPVILLLDGDDPAVERERRKPLLPAPNRLYFYRTPRVESLRHCANSGAGGCLDKLAAPEEVLRALRAIDAGLFAVEPALLRLAMGLPTMAVPAEPDAPDAGNGDPWPELTGRQREIVRWATHGLSNKQIARRLGISPETVKTHLHNIFVREGVRNRMQLAGMRRETVALA